ncbi:MAG: hypothetical protein NTAFB01_13550 [Nitrospira sp.]
MTDATLSAKVTADIADFSKKMGDVKHSVEGLGKGPSSAASATSSAADSIEQSTGRWKTAFLAVGTAVAAGALTAMNTISEWTTATAAAAEKIEQISQQTGIAQTTLEGWGVALNRVGLDTDVFAKSFKALSSDIEKARDATDFSTTKFAQMGLTLKDLGSTEAVIRAVADRIATMTDPVERARLATDLLGKAGLALIPAFMEGSAGLDAAALKAQQFGLVLDQSARTNLLKYDDALDDLGKAWDGLKTRVAVAAAPILLKGVQLAESSITMAAKIIDAILKMVNGVEQAFARLGQIFSTVRQKTQEVTDYFKQMYDAVVGHSYVPDMVEEIGQHVKKLDSVLTAPSRRAAISTENAFQGMTMTIGDLLDDLRQRSSYVTGAIIQNLSSGFAGAIQGTQTLAQVGQQVLNAVLSNALNMILTWTTSWLIAEATRVAATEGANAAIGASTAAVMGAMTATVTAAMTGLKVMMFGVARVALSVVGMVIAAITPVVMAVATVVGTIMEVIGTMLIQLGTAMLDIPFVGPILGGIMIGMGGLASAAGAALPGIMAGIMGALAAGVASLGAAIPALAAGGIVSRPTLALIGEAGPEAVVPLGRSFGGQPTQQTIIVQLDGQELMRYVTNKLIPNLRLRGAPI